ncbi:MAG: electron transfer flavoprotein subunit beta [Candidatus Puniceispirillum sp.]|nr:electron transfer flavoprotein subunit beta [Candidatus Puniceispirillum sp.]
MKVLVSIKRVLDYNMKARVKADGSGMDLAGLKMSMNPFDEIAVEEAVRMKEAGVADEIIVVSIGPSAAQETLRSALALGADRAILVETQDTLEPYHVAKILAKIVESEKPDLCLLGKQAIDDDANQTAQMLAGFLNWSQATFASKIDVTGDAFKVTREVDGGLETLTCRRPCVISVDLRLNEPRYPKLPNIMQAKKKPLDMVPVASYGMSLSPTREIIKVAEPATRKAGIKVPDVATLVQKLDTEARVLS